MPHWLTSQMFHFRFTLAPLGISYGISETIFGFPCFHYWHMNWPFQFGSYFAPLIYTMARFECYTPNRLSFYEHVSIDGPIDIVMISFFFSEREQWRKEILKLYLWIIWEISSIQRTKHQFCVPESIQKTWSIQTKWENLPSLLLSFYHNRNC